MANSNNKLAFDFEVDFSDAEKKLQAFLQRAAQVQNALGGGSGPGSGSGGGGAANQLATQLNRGAQAAQQLQQRMALLLSTQQQLSRQPGMSAELARVDQELARIYAGMRRNAQTENEYVQNLRQEVELQRQARQLTNQARGGSGEFSAHSQRQMSLLQSLQGGENGEGGAVSFLAGKGSAALTAVIGTLGAAFKELGQAAQETARSVSDAGGKFDQLRMSETLKDFSKSMAANSAGAAHFQQIQNELEARFWGGVGVVLDGLDKLGTKLKQWGESPGQVAGENQAALLSDLKTQANGTPLIGDQKIGLDNLLRSQREAEQDMALERQDYEHNIAKTRRDLTLEIQKSELDFARKRQDVEKDRAREQQDYQLKLQKFNENFEGQQAQRKYDLSRQQAERDHSLKMQYAAQDFALERQYKSQDLGKDLRRSGEDYQNELADLSNSNASGLEFLKAKRNFDLAQRRKVEDFQIEQSRAGQKFGIEQGRSQTEYENQKKDAANARLLEIMQMEYQRRYELVDIEKEHSRAIQDTTINLERMSQDLALTRQGLANRQSDINYEDQMARQKMGIQQSRTRRGFEENLQDTAYQLYKSNPAGFINQIKADPRLAEWFNQRQGRAGEGWGFDMDKIRQQQADAMQAYFNQLKGGGANGETYSGDVRTPGGPAFPVTTSEQANLDQWKDKLTPTQYMELASLPPNEQANWLRKNGYARAGGGPVSANQPYLVGEGGQPELFIPDRSGTIVSNSQLMNYAPPSTLSGRGSDGVSMSFASPTFNGGGFDQRRMQEMWQQMLGDFYNTAVMGAIAKNNAAIIDTAKTNLQSQRRGY